MEQFFCTYMCQVQVIFKIRYTLSGSQSIQESDEYFLKGSNTSNPNFICLKGIPGNPTFSGPSTVQKCCLTNVTYTASNVGDATTFDNWTYPAGWTLVSQTGSSITLTPNASGAGSITCRAGIPSACPAGYYKNVSMPITRTDAALSINAGQFPTNRICPNNSYSFAINPVCGATDYTWQFPSGFSITGYVSNKTVANVSTGAVIASGNVTITAVFNGCANASLTVPVSAITGSPAQVPPFNTSAPNYHCDAWYICRNGSSISFLSPAGIDVQTFTYTLSTGWHFKNASNQNVSTITLPFGQFAPMIYSNACITSGIYTVRANNCLGSSAPVSLSFYRESECWCTGQPPYPYTWGSNKPCLTPPSGCGTCGGQVPFRPAPRNNNQAETVIKSTRIYPNPAGSLITVEMKETGLKQIKAVSFNGTVVHQLQATGQKINVDVSGWQKGVVKRKNICKQINCTICEKDK
jgi:hypothetical protein